MTKLHEAVSDHAKENDLTMNGIANELNMSRSTLFNKLAGRNELTLSEGYELSRILGCTIDDLYSMTTSA